MTIRDLANNDNEIIDVIFVDDEFEILVRCWDGSDLAFKTVGCTGADYDTEHVSEIGDIDIEDGLYIFRDAWEGKVFLKIHADDIVQITYKEGLEE